jgi:uncharacterized protein YneR
MKLEISESALAWFKDELGLADGDKVKFFVKYGGSSPVQPGFSLGISPRETPRHIGVSTTAGGILFFIEEDDLWYFDKHDLYVQYNEQHDELEFMYKKGGSEG